MGWRRGRGEDQAAEEAMATSPTVSLVVQDYAPMLKLMVMYFLVYYAFLTLQAFMKVVLFNVWRGRKTILGLLDYTEMRYAQPEVAAIKYGRGAARKGTDAMMSLIVDRAVGNYLEQMGPFLCSSWLHATFSPGGIDRAAALGGVYVVSRMIYPLMFYIGHPWLQISTYPGYVVIWANIFYAFTATRP